MMNLHEYIIRIFWFFFTFSDNVLKSTNCILVYDMNWAVIWEMETINRFLVYQNVAIYDDTGNLLKLIRLMLFSLVDCFIIKMDEIIRLRVLRKICEKCVEINKAIC